MKVYVVDIDAHGFEGRLVSDSDDKSHSRGRMDAGN